MTRFYRAMRGRWATTFYGAALLIALVWIFGPLLGIGPLHPLDSELARGLVIVVILAAWLIENLLHGLRAQKRDAELAEGVTAAAAQPDASATASAEEVATLSERLREALAALKHAKLGGRGGRYLYQLPWYMFIGPPGAGKTTALANCGLTFPLAEKFGPAALRGVGGTRNCDWWFTDQAVLIDTAGRYTTQDSDQAVDAASWLGFLKLLKKYRRRQPLNGVLVAISLADLASLNEAERGAHARAVRRRVRELQDELGVRMPIYVLFTKADLIAGFVEFFDNLGKEEREQVWGMTFALDDAKSEDGAVAEFGSDFERLIERLNDRVMERVHQEPDLARRRLIWGFPQQMASLRDLARAFLTEAFRPSRLEARPLLRGVYLTSGTQDGTPIDRLLGAMAGEFGLPRAGVTAFSGAGRSYFLARLIRDVVFGEAGLVSTDPKVERRHRVTSYGAYAAAAAVLVLATGLWAWSWQGNRALITDVHYATARYNQQVADLAKRGPNDVDVPAVLPALATLRGIRGGYDERDRSTPVGLTFGLYQGYKLSVAANDGYHRALNGLLLPRLLARLETQMRANMAKPDLLYETLKVYLMLGRQGPLDRPLIEQWLAADFASAYPGDEGAPTREAVAAHLHAMLEQPLPALGLDGPLVAQARAVLTREPLAEYLYNRLMRSATVQSQPVWTVADNAGPAGARVFTLRDGKPLNTGVPGIFTTNGYHNVFLPLLPGVTRNASEDSWVLGRASTEIVVPPEGEKKKGLFSSAAARAGEAKALTSEMGKLRRDVIALYLDDYTQRWDTLIADLALKPFTTLSQGQDELFALSAPDSPLRDLLTAINTQTQLSHTPAADAAAAEAGKKASKVASSLGGAANTIARAGMSFEQAEIATVLGEAFGSDAAGKPIDPAKRVDEHFKDLHVFVTGDNGGPAPLETVLAKTRDIYQGLNQAANAPNQGAALLGMVAGGGGGGGGAAAAASQLKDLATSVPKPIAAMLQTVSQSSAQVTASGASKELSDAWASKVLPLCKAAFNRYPFVRGSSEDVPLDDFTRLLGPGGLMDQFFDQNLKPFVDTTTKPWHWQSGNHTQLGLAPGSLADFERAADIRDSLFPTGQAMSVKFQLNPISLDPGVAQVSVEVAGQRLAYAHGPAEPMMFTWPGQTGTEVRLTMTPANGGGSATVTQFDDAWALLRLLDTARISPSGQPDRFRISFSSPAGNAEFQLNAASVRNPFTLSALRAFRCPSRL